ncbi:hypothetical protein GKZ90_0013875 [Flavobacterium sp. MC2016-06]|jgi:membrane protein YdbS with pleckstrin-like domain|uniref:hypothetical protein n=1 Tax=Flavobacterium sp. MC2016-06 TaxID=2676308 RepID=UPI00209B36EC|nr:hypothetical protein [Flavobacterium sp. MC2016-06]
MLKKYSSLIIFVLIEIILAFIGYSLSPLSNSLLLSILTALFFIGTPILYYVITRKRQTEFTSWFVFYLAFKITPYVFTMENNFFQLLFRFKIYLNILFLFYLMFKIIVFIKSFRKDVLQKKNEDIDEYTFISNSLQESVKFKNLGKMIAFEVCSFYYCFIKWNGNKNNEIYFTGYKNSGVGAIYIGLMLVSVVEAVGLHFLLISWNKIFAIIFLILHVYLLINLTGHLKAIFFRRHFISNEKIIIRYGLFETVEIPISTIDEITKYEGDYERNKDLVKFALLGKLEAHNISLELKNNIQINLPFGIIKKPKNILFYIDDVSVFIKTIKDSMEYNQKT